MVARGSNVGALSSLISTGSASHPLPNETGKKPPRDVPIVFKVLVYPTIISVVLVVGYSDHEDV